MTQSPCSPQGRPQGWQQPAQPPLSQPPANEPMNIYPSPEAYGMYPGRQAKAPAWPTVVGIISLCVAGISFLMTIAALIMAAASAKIQPAQSNEWAASVPGWVEVCNWFANAIHIAMYVVLAIGGVMLLKRRRAGRTMHVVYITAEVVMVIYSLVVMVVVMQHMPQPANAPPYGQALLTITLVTGVIAGMAFAMAYPTFLVIWFSRPKVREHIQTWQKQPGMPGAAGMIPARNERGD